MANIGITRSPADKTARGRGRLWQLEALRGLAALHVLLNHVFTMYFNAQHVFWGYPFRFGQEAVLIFFLLSGFVICYSHGSRDADAGSFKIYLFKRGRRIYPIFIFSLILAYGVSCAADHQFAGVDFRSLAGNLCMLQDSPGRAGWFVLPYKGNAPLWSLSYEWWFYMMFYPINRWVPVRRQKYLVLGLCMAGMVANRFIPNSIFNFLMLFLIWWTGVEMAREYIATGGVTLRRQGVMLALLAVPAIWHAGLSWQLLAAGHHIAFNDSPFVELRYFLMTAVFMLICFGWKRLRFAGFRQTIGQFEWLGSISYGLYVVHYPLICNLRFFDHGGRVSFYTDLALRVLLAFALAWLAEGILQKWINAATNPWLATARKNRAR